MRKLKLSSVPSILYECAICFKEAILIRSDKYFCVKCYKEQRGFWA